MKKIIMIFLLIFIFSCSKSVDKENLAVQNNNNTTNLDLSKASENLNKQVPSIDNKEDIKENNNENISDLNVDYSKIIEDYKNYSNLDKASLICEKTFNTEKNSNLKNFLDDCIYIRSKAQEIVKNNINNFKISDCKDLINSNIKFIPPNISKEKFIDLEISKCEMSFALKNGCENLKEQKRIDLCTKLVDFQKLKLANDFYSNFDILKYQ